MRNNLLLIAAVATGVGLGGAQLARPATAAAPVAAAPATRVTAIEVRPAPRSVEHVLRASRAVLAAGGVESGAEAAQVSRALAALEKSVRRQSDPAALRMAFKAYFAYKAAHPEQVRKPYLYFVDYGLGAQTPRGYVFDMAALKVVDGPFTVAHGRGSAPKGEAVPSKFSNVEGSAASSLGLFLAQETYGFSGKAGGKPYRSVGLRMKGLSGRFNSAARQRRVVVHGAPYVTPAKAGRSEGCPAMEQARARVLLPKIGNGGMVFLFSPVDRTWMRQDPWASGDETPAVAMAD